MAEFRMPSLGPDMDEGTIVEWLVKRGDIVHRGEVVAVVQTDKADIDVEVFQDGTVEEILVDLGVKVPVGTALARLSGPEPAPPPDAFVAVVPRTPDTVATATEARPGKLPPSLSRVWSPLVRHLAEANGIDLGSVHGTGPAGSIRRGDVERAVRQARGRGRHRISPRARHLAAQQGIDLDQVTGSRVDGVVTGDDILGLGTVEPADRHEMQRRAVGELMARSKREIPHYYLSLEVEVGAALDRLREHNSALPPPRRVLPAALLLQAVVHAATRVPGFNGHWDETHGYVAADSVDLGVAVALRTGGLIAPTLRHADKADLDELNSALRDLVARARSGHLSAAEASDATLTVTNLGDRGASAVFGAIVPPQVAIVGFGRVGLRPWVVDHPKGAAIIAPRPVVTVTLSADHRVTNGHEGSRFLDEAATFLQRPQEKT